MGGDMTERTPGPWRRDPKRAMRIVAGQDDTVASVGSQPSLAEAWEANAAAIVRWENHFDELTEALAHCCSVLEKVPNASNSPIITNAVANSRVLLAKVKES